MAIKQEIWDKAKLLFEHGKPLNEIVKETGINKSTVSKKSKSESWVKFDNKSTLVLNEVDTIIKQNEINQQKSTLNPSELNFHEQEVANILRRENLVYGATEKALAKIDKALDKKYIVKDEEGNETEEEVEYSAKDMKDYIDGIDKASITLGVNQRHANSQVVVNNQNNLQQKTSIELTEEQAKKKALDLGVPLSALTSH